MSNLPARSELAKTAVRGFGALGGGVALLVLAGLSRGLIGVIVGGALAVVGLSVGSSRSDRTAGVITAAAGILSILSGLSSIVGGFPNLSGMMWVAGIGLAAYGGFSLYRFFTNLRRRM